MFCSRTRLYWQGFRKSGLKWFSILWRQHLLKGSGPEKEMIREKVCTWQTDPMIYHTNNCHVLIVRSPYSVGRGRKSDDSAAHFAFIYLSSASAGLFFCYKSHFVNVTAKPNKILFHSKTRCLKITEKVSFNIASEASYVYIMSGQKFIKNAKNWTILASFWNLKLAVKQCYQTKIGGKCQNLKIQCDFLSNFQTMLDFFSTEKNVFWYF